jgi:hypothetical protein
MSDFIRIDSNSREIIKGFEKYLKNDFPYAIAVTLTDTAKQAQKEIQRKMPEQFTIRKSRVITGVRIEPAKKTDFKNFGFCQAVVKDIDPFMADHESGNKRPAKKRLRVIPEGIRPNKKDLIKKSQRPGAILKKKKKYFIGVLRYTGVPGIWERLPDNNLKLLYSTKPIATIKPVFHFVETVKDITGKNIVKNFESNFKEIENKNMLFMH